MDSNDLEDLYSKKFESIKRILNKFNEDNKTVFNFEIFHNGNLWFKVWKAIIYLLNDYEMDKVHLMALNSARILSRDKISLENNNIGEDAECFLKLAYLTTNKSVLLDNESELNNSTIYIDSIEKNKIAEALKCLCNLVYQSSKCRQYCVSKNAVDHIIHRMSSNLCISYEIELFDAKLLFLITALERSVVDRVLIDLNGFTYILENLNQKLHTGDSYRDDQLNTIVHLLKTIYNIMFFSPNSFCNNEIENLRLLAVIRALIFRFGGMSNRNERDIISHCINVLVQTSSNYLDELVTNFHDSEKEVIFENYNVYAIKVLINFFHVMAENLETSNSSNESVLPVLTVLSECVSCHRILRHYIRSVILPPLKDVSQRPEIGKELRNYLCRLQSNPDENLRKLTFKLLFLCCKKNAGRIVKYFGYGNAAGLLCDKGMLDCRRITTELSSDSSESDTEDYKRIQHTVNPITGTYQTSHCTLNMSEEEKEFHAMKLVSDIDKLQRSGIMTPCKIDENGTIQPVDHILQLQDGLKTKCNINSSKQ